MSLSRRGFMAAAALGAAASATGGFAAHAEPHAVAPGELDYQRLTLRGYNRRFVAQPKRIHIPSDTGELRDAVARSVRDDLRLAIRSGGHCFDDFVDSTDTRSLIDLQRLNTVGWDEQHNAFSVGAGADLDAVYRGLSRWGVTIPGGICRAVGVGGHISGGGYGPLSRQFGLVADHLYGVEIVTVDARGESSLMVATKDGPHRDLWWANTGGGGGNFGVVSRFLLRSPDSDGTDPTLALPRRPDSVLVGRLLLPMPMVTEESFVRFLGNYLDFYARYREPGNRFAGLYARLIFRPLIEGFADLLIFSYGPARDAQSQLDEFLATVTDGVTPAPVLLPPARLSYADSIEQYYAPPTNPSRVKIKAAMLRQPYSPEQLRILYRALIGLTVNGESFVEFAPFGGAINATAPDATAMPARDSFMKMLIHATWRDPGDDDRFISWARTTYGNIYADTGAAPVPDDRNGGSYINYPDPDLADPVWNTSTTPWHALYYGANYTRLQRIKAEWDPKNIFRHRLSIEPH
ncbi:BBE domain-containing protein [Nocardia sp. CA-129566]|uniref:FAD-dependent oxidoreductase n=1 Tax=Nocardia sp. CA-129566 TaxID=3239976 RepID=UPI003D99088D